MYALSRSAYKIQYQTISKRLPSADIDILMRKTAVLYPPQNIIITENELNIKYNVQKIHFLFVGRGFFIKGGREVIRVLSEFAGCYDFRLTLISTLNYNDYITKAPYEEKLKWKKNIRETEWIDYYEFLPNETVLEKCREASVGLLPLYGDTFGYSVLEMQAAGCPVITTNVKALPEINNEECGWICKLPIDIVGRCTEKKDAVRAGLLEQELRRCFQEIFAHPELISMKGKKTLKRIEEMHNPHNYQLELKKI